MMFGVHAVTSRLCVKTVLFKGIFDQVSHVSVTGVCMNDARFHTVPCTNKAIILTHHLTYPTMHWFVTDSESDSEVTSPSTPTRESAKIPLPTTLISGKSWIISPFLSQSSLVSCALPSLAYFPSVLLIWHVPVFPLLA